MTPPAIITFKEQVLNRMLPPPSRRIALRRAAGYTQQDVAKYLGCDQSTVSDWERGRTRPTGARLRMYVEMLRTFEEIQQELLEEAAK